MSVFLAQSKSYGFQVAIKINTEIDASKEVDFINQARHLLVVELFDLFEYNGYQCVMEEYIDGKSLLDYANSRPIFIEDEARDIFIQLAAVVHHLHKTSNITHRDLKCENVLLDFNNNIRLIDFGFTHDWNC